MKKCPYCGYENNDNATNCGCCYAGLPEKEKPKEKSEETEQKPVSRRRVRS